MMVILSNQKYDHAGRRQCESRRSQTNDLEQRQVDRGKGPSAAKHVWSIRTKLQIEGRTRNLAIFNLAIDSKLRGCDVVALKVDDIAPHGCAVDRATVRQKRTGIPVRYPVFSSLTVSFSLPMISRSRRKASPWRQAGGTSGSAADQI